MYVCEQPSPTSKRVQVYLVEGYRGSDGKARRRIVRKCGERGELLAADPAAIEKLKEEAKRLTAEKREAKVTVELDTLRARRAGERGVCCGHFFAEGLWRQLGLRRFLQRKGKAVGAPQSFADICELLVFSRLLAPASKAATWAHRDDLFDSPDCELHEVYRCLDVLDAVSADLQAYLHRRLVKDRGRDTRLVFYDVTNYWFEIDLEDDLRRRGASKERRRDPIVQMGLLIDGDGIPIAHRLFAGNTHDAVTLAPVLTELRDRYGLGRIVVVADKGLNAKANLAVLDSAGDGWIVAQKVRGQIDQEIRKELCAKSGWSLHDDGRLAVKSFLRTRRLGKDNERKEKVVLLRSADHAAREAARRAEVVPLAHDLVEHPGRYEALRSRGRGRYVKEEHLTAAGEVMKPRLSFDAAGAKADAALDGYACLLTSECEMDELEIIGHYRGLAKIEDSFRVLKSELEGRPVYVRTRQHIGAHFLICFLALVLLRLLQTKTDNELSAGAIREALRSATCTPLEKGIWAVDETTEAYKKIEEAFGVGLPQRYAPLEAIRGYRRQIIRAGLENTTFSSG